MSLIAIRQIHPDARLGLWRIDETLETMLCRRPFLAGEVASYRNEGRKLERLSVYELLFLMTGDLSLRLSHNQSGKPLLPGWQVSISHTRGYVAVILSKEQNIGIDIEYPSDRVSRIVSRFLRVDEHAETLEKQLLFWCAKETVYKFFSEQALEFHEMKVHDVVLQPIGQLMVSNLRTSTDIVVHYSINKDYCLTYAVACFI